MAASVIAPKSPADTLAEVRAARSAAAEKGSAALGACELAREELSRRKAEIQVIRVDLATGRTRQVDVRAVQERIAELEARIAELAPDADVAARVDDLFADRERTAYEQWVEVENDRLRAESGALYESALAAASEARDALGALIALEASAPRGSLGLVPARALRLCNDLEAFVSWEIEHHAIDRAPRLRYRVRPEPRRWPSTYVIERPK